MFGRADVQAGSQDYEQARQMGGLLARAGAVVVTGGYGGVMEGASLGATEAGGEAEGVVCRAFEGRSPNPYLTRLHWTNNLFERTQILIERADGYVALAPRTGTLSEVVTVWAHFKAGHLSRRPLLLVGRPWEQLFSAMADTGVVEQDLLNWSIIAADVGEAAARLTDWTTSTGMVHDG